MLLVRAKIPKNRSILERFSKYHHLILTRSRARSFPPNSNTDKSSSENIAEVLCDAASIHPHRISQNVMFATEFALCHHFPRPCQCDSQKTRNTTHLKRCVCHAKLRWSSPKCCAWHEKCISSFGNGARVLRLPQKTIFDAFLKHVGMSQSATPAT